MAEYQTFNLGTKDRYLQETPKHRRLPDKRKESADNRWHVSVQLERYQHLRPYKRVQCLTASTSVFQAESSSSNLDTRSKIYIGLVQWQNNGFQTRRRGIVTFIRCQMAYDRMVMQPAHNGCLSTTQVRILLRQPKAPSNNGQFIALSQRRPGVSTPWSHQIYRRWDGWYRRRAHNPHLTWFDSRTLQPMPRVKVTFILHMDRQSGSIPE